MNMEWRVSSWSNPLQSIPSEGEVKWKIYRCHTHLKENQEALDVVR